MFCDYTGWHSNWQCTVQGLHDARGPTEGSVQPSSEKHHQSCVHRWRRKSDRSKSLPAGVVIPAGGARENWSVIIWTTTTVVLTSTQRVQTPPRLKY